MVKEDDLDSDLSSVMVCPYCGGKFSVGVYVYICRGCGFRKEMGVK